MLSCFLPIAKDSSANSNSHSYISNFIIIEQLSMRNNHNMRQRHMAAQIISGMFCMNSSLHDQTPTTDLMKELAPVEGNYIIALFNPLLLLISYQPERVGHNSDSYIIAL